MTLGFILAAGKGKRFMFSEYFPKQLVYIPKYGFLIQNLIKKIENICNEIKISVSVKYYSLFEQILDKDMLLQFPEVKGKERKLEDCRYYVKRIGYKGDILIVSGDFLSKDLLNYPSSPSFLIVDKEKILDTSKEDDIVIVDKKYINSLIFDVRERYKYVLGRVCSINSDLLLRTKSKT